MPGEWQPIETAPKDGTAIQARIPGHGDNNIIACHPGLVGENGEDVLAWCFASEQEPPDDWTDGWCWAVNEDGVPSTHPTHWRPRRAKKPQAKKSRRGPASPPSPSHRETET